MWFVKWLIPKNRLKKFNLKFCFEFSFLFCNQSLFCKILKLWFLMLRLNFIRNLWNYFFLEDLKKIPNIIKGLVFLSMLFMFKVSSNLIFGICKNILLQETAFIGFTQLCCSRHSWKRDWNKRHFTLKPSILILIRN